MRTGALLLACGATSLPSVVHAQATTVAGGAAARDWVSMESKDTGFITIRAVVDGLPVIAMIDTGFPRVTISPRLADRLHKTIRPLGTAHSVGGRQDFGVVDKVSVSVGDRSFEESSVEVASFSNLEEALGTAFDLVIGASLIAKTGLEVDADQGRVRLGVPAGHQPRDLRIPVRFDGDRSEFTTSLSVGNTVISPVLIDTGSDVALSIDEEKLESLPRHAGLMTDIMVAGGGGRQVEHLLTIPEVKIGNVRLNNVLAQAEPDDGFLAGRNLEGALGISLLERFNFSVDPQSGSIWLRARDHEQPTQLKSTIGIQGDVRSDRIDIAHVMANSPAQAAGLHDKDQICAINDQPITPQWLRSPLARWGTGPAGIEYTLRLCDGRTFHVRSTSFY